MKNETSYQSFSEQQSKELKTIERRIDFHLAKNPKNGFQNNIIPQSKLSSNGKKIESLNKNKSSNELFDPKIIEEMISWNKVRRIGPGFFNLGNSCFLNSTLQCLLYIPPLTQVLLDENLKVIKTDSYSNQLMLSHFQRFVIEAFATSSAKSIAPRVMVQNIRNVGKQFRPMRQEDAHEYLRKLIDCMHEEILKQHGLKIQDGKITETTFIFRVFGGNLRNELLCTKCHYSSKTFNPFLDLSLEIAKGITSVNVAIKTFTQAEKLTVGNEWNCEGCKTKVQARKQLTVFKAPQVLVLHLKRFNHQGQFNTKINKHIEFSIDLTLDCSGEIPKQVEYRLVGVITHYGNSVHSGHYVAFVQAPNSLWYEMNDSQVSQVSVNRVLQQQAYILFYVRKNPSAESSSNSIHSSPRDIIPPSVTESLHSKADQDVSINHLTKVPSGGSSSGNTDKNHLNGSIKSMKLFEIKSSSSPLSLTKDTSLSQSAVVTNQSSLLSSDMDDLTIDLLSHGHTIRKVYSNGHVDESFGEKKESSFHNIDSDDIGEIIHPIAVQKPTSSNSIYSTREIDLGLNYNVNNKGYDNSIVQNFHDKRLRIPVLNSSYLSPLRWTGKLSRFTQWKHKKLIPLRNVKQNINSEATVDQPRNGLVDCLKDGKSQTSRNFSDDIEKSNESRKLGNSMHQSSDTFRELLNQSRRGREIGGEGLWEGISTLKDDLELKKLITAQRREEQRVLHSKRLSEWNQLLDQGKLKKVKLKKDDNLDLSQPNPFQLVGNQIMNGISDRGKYTQVGFKHKRNHTKKDGWKE